MDIVKSVETGEFLTLKLAIQDLPARPREYPTYLVTCYLVGINSTLSMELSGIYNSRPLRKNGQPITRIVITWSLPVSPPSIAFSFLPCPRPVSCVRWRAILLIV